MSDNYPTYSWLSEPDDNGNETYVSIYPTGARGMWELS